MKNNKLSQFLVLFSVIAMLVLISLAVALPIGEPIGETNTSSPRVIFYPAGYAFAIWSVIYTSLLVYAIWQALPSQRENPRLRAIAPWVSLNAVCNGCWVPLAQTGYLGATVLLIFVLFGTLLLVMDRLRLAQHQPSPTEYWLTYVPFSIYFGWTTVATIANTTPYLKASGVELLGLSEVSWAIIMLVVGFGVSAFLFVRHRSAAYMLVIVWAYVAIAVEQQAYPSVQFCAGVGAVGALLLALSGVRSRYRLSHQQRYD